MFRREILSLFATTPLAVAGAVSAQSAPAPSIPAGNRPNLTSPPPRPPLGDVQARMRLLVNAINAADASLAASTFLSRDAFRLIKGVDRPDPVFDRLLRLFDRDVRALHDLLGPAPLAYESFSFSTRRSFVLVREEANRLPYWSQRHSWLTVRAGDQRHRIEVRTMIAWDDRWFITHLSDVH